MSNMTTTYHNDPELKSAFVAQARAHRRADQFIQGTYARENGVFRGCSVGCSVDSLKQLGRLPKDTASSDHASLAQTLGWLEWLCHLQDSIFENLPIEDAVFWTERLAEAVPVGRDIEPVRWKFYAFLMRENIERVLALPGISDALREKVVCAIRGVLRVHERAIETGAWDESAARSAESAARSASESARSAARSAWSAAESAWIAAESAWSAAESAARSAGIAAWSAAAWSAWSARSAWSAAAWSARSAAAWSAWSARSGAWSRYANELIQLLEAAK